MKVLPWVGPSTEWLDSGHTIPAQVFCLSLRLLRLLSLGSYSPSSLSIRLIQKTMFHEVQIKMENFSLSNQSIWEIWRDMIPVALVSSSSRLRMVAGNGAGLFLWSLRFLKHKDHHPRICLFGSIEQERESKKPKERKRSRRPIPSRIRRGSLEIQIWPLLPLELANRRVIDDEACDHKRLLIPTCHGGRRLEPWAEQGLLLWAISRMIRMRPRVLRVLGALLRQLHHHHFLRGFPTLWEKNSLQDRAARGRNGDGEAILRSDYLVAWRSLCRTPTVGCHI